MLLLVTYSNVSTQEHWSTQPLRKSVPLFYLKSIIIQSIIVLKEWYHSFIQEVSLCCDKKKWYDGTFNIVVLLVSGTFSTL